MTVEEFEALHNTVSDLLASVNLAGLIRRF